MPDQQPPVVRAAVVVIVGTAVLTVTEAVSTIKNIGSPETVDSLNKGLLMGWFRSAHPSITALQDALRMTANASAVLAAAVAVLAIFAGRRSRQSRIALTVAALPVLIVSVMTGEYAGLGMLVGIGLLWSRDARSWFVPEAAGARPAPPAASARPPAPATYTYPTGAPTAPVPGPPSPPSPPGQVPPHRPQRVTSAAVIAIVLSALAAGGALMGAIGLAVLHARPDLRQSVVDRAQAYHFSLSVDDLDREMTAATITAVVIVVLGLLGIAAAVLVLRGSPRGRIALIVLSAICAVASVLMIGSIISLVWLIGAVAVIVGLGATDSVAWFKQR